MLWIGRRSGGDPYFSSVVLLALNENGADGGTTFDDQSTPDHALTANGNVQWDDASAPTGLTSSGLFDGTGDFISATDSDDWTLTADLTVEFFFRSTQTLAFAAPMWQHASGTGWGFAFNSATGNGRMAFWHSTFSTSIPIVLGTTDLGDGAWHHVAATAASDVWNIWINGTSEANRTASFVRTNFTHAFMIGRQSGLSRDFNGHIAAVRITKGVARYTGTFTPPTLPYPTS